MTSHDRVLVYGATGHTGRFVTDELLRRGLVPVLAGRSAERLAAVPARHAALDRRVVGIDDPDQLRQAVAGAGALINCAGPFLDTALPLARAAVESGAHYLDVTAEQPVVRSLYRDLDAPARAAGVVVVPAMAFYGGLADLLVTAALDGGSLEDLRDAATPAPAATDEAGRSAQRFVVDVAVRRGAHTWRTSASGRDIYAVSAPIVVEGAVRLLDGRHRGPGAAAPGEAFDAADVLATLERDLGAVAVRSERSVGATQR